MYRLTRDFHLYAGLFVSPFVLLFAASVFFMNHGKVLIKAPQTTTTVQDLQIPAGIAEAKGGDAVIAVKHVLAQCGITGEIGFIRNLRNAQRLVIPVLKPGSETTVTIDLAGRSASVSRRTMGPWETLAYLHKSPGPHNADIRGNWAWTRAWRWPADATVYLLLFISLTGLYLWFALRAERRVGVALLMAGAVSFFGTMYAVVR